MKYLDEDENEKMSNNEDPFEPEIVVQKMKKIKRTKKKSNNYKNIEPLTNIYEQEYEIPDDTSTTPDKKKQGKVIREGLSQNGIANFSENDYTGKDDIYEGGDAAHSPINNISDFINYCYNAVHSIPLYIALLIIEGIEGLSSGISNISKGHINISDNISINDKVNDQKVIARYIGWTFCIGISTYVIYNWFFIIAYKNEKKEVVELPIIFDRKMLYNKGVFDASFKLIHYFFEHSIFFPEYLQKGIIKGSEKLRSTFNPSFLFTMLFFFIIFGLYHTLSFIRDLLLAIVTVNMKNIVLAFMFTIISGLLMISFFNPPIKINVDTWADMKILGPSVIAQMTEIITSVNPVKGIMNLVIWFFYILFVLFFGVPVAALLCMGYLFAYTFFGIILLKWFDFNEIKELILKKIPKYARSEKGKIKVETFCVRLTFWEKVENYIHEIFDGMYKYCIEIAIIYMLLFGIYDYWYKLRLRNVRLTLFTTAIILLTFILGILYLHIKAENANMPTVAVTQPPLPPSTITQPTTI